MNIEIRSEARPHPGPLPQERGNRTPSPVKSGDQVVRADCCLGKSATEIASGTAAGSKRVESLSLSRRERAGVRVSVHPDSSTAILLS